jgi:signal peptidase
VTLRSHASTTLTVALFVVVAALAVGQLLGQPVLLGYVATDSMEPTMDSGDGFVAVPSALTGDIEEGDVVVYEAQELDGGGLTTHRVVGETDEGYITKGDANPFTDQDSDEPPVAEGRIVAEAAQIDGGVIVIPNLGTGVMGLQSAIGGAYTAVAGSYGAGFDDSTVGSLLVGIGLLSLAAAAASGARVRDLGRSTTRPDVVAAWTVVGVAAVLVVGLATAAMVVPSGIQEYGIVSAEQQTDDTLVIPAGESTTVEHRVRNGGIVPVVVFLEPSSERVGVQPDRLRIGGGDTAETTVRLSAPDRTGYYYRHVTEHRYLLVLPPSVIETLHGVHPVLALLAVDATIAAVVLATAIAILGTGDLRLRSGGDHVALTTRLSRRLRKWR